MHTPLAGYRVLDTCMSRNGIAGSSTSSIGIFFLFPFLFRTSPRQWLYKFTFPRTKRVFPHLFFSFFVALELQVCSTTPNLAFVFLIALFTRVGCNHYVSICISLLAKDIKLFKILLCPCVSFKHCSVRWHVYRLAVCMCVCVSQFFVYWVLAPCLECD